jgi:Kelch motif/PQQ-like domain
VTTGNRLGPSYHARRRASQAVRARRTGVAAILGLVAVAVILVVVLPSDPGSRRTSTTGPGDHRAKVAMSGTPRGATPAIEAGVVPWTLGSALSREVVLSGSGSSVTVAGGLTAAQSSSSTVFSLDTTSGAETALAPLATAVHDAAGVRLLGHGYLFGGGSPDTVATVQRFSTPTAGGVNPSAVSQLPQPRSDSQVVTVGRTTYVVGGYDGTEGDRNVLATTDGEHFKVAARLPLAVRYPAVAATGDRIYVFGGQAVGGPHNGSAVDTVQMVSPPQGTAIVVAHMPGPLAGASAAVLGGHIYIAGGVSTTGGTQEVQALHTVWAYDVSARRLENAGTLPVGTSYAGAAVVGGRAWIVGGEDGGTSLDTVEMLTPNIKFGTAGSAGAGSPYFGSHLLIADRGNDRLLLLDAKNQTVWTYPSAYAAAPPGGFYFPDDAFFTARGTEIVSNQEKNETIVIISFPAGKVVWSYGHPRQVGSQPGYLYEPDDAYVLKNGQITIADANNCRILFINRDGSIASQIGTTGSCVHDPPTSLGSPNGDTPLADGNVLISEINGSWVSEYTPIGKLVWTVKLPVGYASDPQQLGPDLYLVSDYSHPGGFIEFTREGAVLYRYQPASGLGEMNKPSLTEILPSGAFLTNDDYRDRMVAIDPATQALVWQYGVTDQPGTAPGMLNTPDGFDLILPDGTTPTHLASG